MRLHLRTELPFDDDFRRGESCSDITARGAEVRAMDIAVLGQLPRRTAEELRAYRVLKHPGCIGPARRVDLGDKRQPLVIDADERDGFLRGLRRERGDRGDGIAHVLQVSLSRLPVARAGKLDRPSDGPVDDLHGEHAGMALGRCDIERENPGVRMGRAQQTRMEHAGQLHIDGERCAAGHLGPTVAARRGATDRREFGIGRQRRRFARRDVPVDLTERHAGDAERIAVAAGLRGHDQLFPRAAMSMTAAITCG